MTVRLTIDGRRAEADTGAYLLQVARSMDITIPTLCDHPDLEPVGACRLCLVEVTHPDWGGWSGLMTACIYPVADGLQVSTHSPRVLQARRGLLALLAARCPASEAIQRLARQYDVQPGRLVVNPDDDDCILCGLCTRICETYATSAIATINRGATKQVGSFFDSAHDCVGCGACAVVCPTRVIASQREAGRFTIWHQSFEIPVATVDPERCVGCGACEEACPFAVARVSLQMRPDGACPRALPLATIPDDQCRGCGACVGACPVGAIDQASSADWSTLISIVAEHHETLAKGGPDA